MLRIFVVLALTCGLAGSHAIAQVKPDSVDLASLHQVRVRGCKACHETEPASQSAEQAWAKVNAKCITCHGDAASVSAATRAKRSDPHVDPHVSHLVAVDCAVCHAGHDAKRASYCLECHNFDMPMPGAARTSRR